MKAFLEKYFSRRVWDKMKADFLRLIQGSKSIVEYEEQFIALSQFAPMLVADKVANADNILKGYV